MSEKKKKGPEAVVREIKRQTRRKFTSEEKIRIVLEGLRGEESIATLCRQNAHLSVRKSRTKTKSLKKSRLDI